MLGFRLTPIRPGRSGWQKSGQGLRPVESALGPALRSRTWKQIRSGDDRQQGQNFKLEPWDWRYYAEKVKLARYDLDVTGPPLFPLDNVIQGAFAVANKLYGLTFIERKDIPRYTRRSVLTK